MAPFVKQKYIQIANLKKKQTNLKFAKKAQIMTSWTVMSLRAHTKKHFGSISQKEFSTKFL